MAIASGEAASEVLGRNQLKTHHPQENNILKKVGQESPI